jgi:hypothetical protein
MDMVRNQNDKNSLARVAPLVWMINDVEKIAGLNGDHHGLEAKASLRLKDCILDSCVPFAISPAWRQCLFCVADQRLRRFIAERMRMSHIVWGSASGGSEALTCPQGIATGIEHGNYEHSVVVQRIVNTERKTLRQHSVKTKDDLVDACIEHQGLDIRNQAAPEVVTKARMLTLIKPIALDEVSFRIG